MARRRRSGCESKVLLPVGLLEFRRRKKRHGWVATGVREGTALIEKAHIDGAEDSADPGARFSLPSAAGKERAHVHTIRLKLHDINQLFNSMDPSPFIERDLDDDAEEFIVSWAQECPSNASIRLRIYLDQWPAEDPKELIKTAVHNHFSHRVQIARLEFKRLLEQGRTSLLIGLLFLAACLLITNLLLGRAEGTWAAIARESLTIAGWVAMWRPMQIYLYDWWPLLRRIRIYTKLSHMPVEVLQKGKA